MTRVIRIAALIISLIILVQCCSAPKYVPHKENITTSVYGAAIKIQNVEGTIFSGELLSIDNEKVIILTANKGIYKVIEENTTNITSFTLRYAQPVKYGWSIPAYGLFCATHGWFAPITLPINLIVTTSIAAGGSQSYTYNHKQITRQEAANFARFPQGFPPNVSYESIEKANYKEIGTIVYSEHPGLNGGFEYIIDHSPANWFLHNGADTKGVQVVQLSPKAGNYCLRIASQNKVNDNLVQPAITQIVKVNPNRKYLVQFYAKSTDLVLEFRLGDPSDIEGRSIKTLQTKPAKNEWILYEIEFETMANQSTVRMEFAGLNRGSAYLDEISLIEIK